MAFQDTGGVGPTWAQAEAPPESVAGYRRLLVAAMIGTGTFTAGGVAIDAANAVLATTGALTQGLVSGAIIALVLLGGGGIAGYITLALWMMRTRRLLEELGDPVPETWKIWGAWFIPIYAWWGPYKTMDALTRRASVSAAMSLWWALWVGTNVLSNVVGKLDLGSSTVGVLSVINAPMFVGSWLALVTIIRRTTTGMEGALRARGSLTAEPPGLSSPGTSTYGASPNVTASAHPATPESILPPRRF